MRTQDLFSPSSSHVLKCTSCYYSEKEMFPCITTSSETLQGLKTKLVLKRTMCCRCMENMFTSNFCLHVVLSIVNNFKFRQVMQAKVVCQHISIHWQQRVYFGTNFVMNPCKVYELAMVNGWLV